MTKKMWHGTWPAKCDICGRDLAETGRFYDAKSLRGPWGLFCPICFIRHCFGIGTGRGQVYDSATRVKIAG